jgi:hypothetical protein
LRRRRYSPDTNASKCAEQDKTGRGGGNVGGRWHKIPYPNRSDAQIRRKLRFSVDHIPATPVWLFASEHSAALLHTCKVDSARFAKLNTEPKKGCHLTTFDSSEMAKIRVFSGP